MQLELYYIREVDVGHPGSLALPVTYVGWIYSPKHEFPPIKRALSPIQWLMATPGILSAATVPSLEYGIQWQKQERVHKKVEGENCSPKSCLLVFIPSLTCTTSHTHLFLKTGSLGPWLHWN